VSAPQQNLLIPAPAGLPLLTERGRAFLGLEKSSAPDLNERVRLLFESLNEKLGFRDTVEGQVQQEAFNELLRYAYPEIMIDLADLVYVQHERPMVFLNFDHISLNQTVDPDPLPIEVPVMHTRMEVLFYALAHALRQSPELCHDPAIVTPLAESYSFYLWLTKNFPWEDPVPPGLKASDAPVLDVATGLAGFSLIHDWPEGYPPLVLTDSMPFIIEGLRHYAGLSGRQNIEVTAVEFPEAVGLDRRFSRIQVNKFFHHLQREPRKRFLHWCREHLVPGGHLVVVDTDLEYRILKEAAADEFYREKLMPGYLETLVDIEDKFCHHMAEDVRAAGFQVQHFDVHDYYDETDAYSHYPGEDLPLKFMGFELIADR
jgi:hypothetical protein